MHASYMLNQRTPVVAPFATNHFVSRYRCLAKLPENVNPEIDGYRYHRHYDNQDDEQWRNFCFSTRDTIKNNSICDSNDDGSDDKSPHKEVDGRFTSPRYLPPES